MGKRRTARILAISILYQREIRPIELLEDLIYYTLMMDEYEVSVVHFAQKLVRGVEENSEDIDNVIARHADNWSVSRMATMDRNIMRMAIFEIKYLDDIPPNVSINEAVEIAKNYSTEKSGEFVNGVLDRISREYNPSN